MVPKTFPQDKWKLSIIRINNPKKKVVLKEILKSLEVNANESTMSQKL
jgi:hypothetical protein